MKSVPLLRRRAASCLLSALAFVGLFAMAPNNLPLTLEVFPDKGIFAPGEEITVEITGELGSFVLFAADVSPGPVFLPGGQQFDLGLTRELTYYVSLMGAKPLTYRAGLTPDHPWFGAPTYIQAISVNPRNFEVQVSESFELLWDFGLED